MAAEPNIKGIPVTQITSIMGVPVTSVKNIAGIRTLDIPSWPSTDPPGPTCEAISLRYHPSPSLVCSVEEYGEYALGDDNYLYLAGECGTTKAPTGFYADERDVIWSWFESTWESFGRCRRR